MKYQRPLPKTHFCILFIYLSGHFMVSLALHFSGERCCAATFILAFGLCFFSFDSTCLSKNSQFLLSALVSVKSHFLLRGARPFFLLSKNSSFYSVKILLFTQSLFLLFLLLFFTVYLLGRFVCSFCVFSQFFWLCN